MSEEKTSTKYEMMLLLLPDLGEKATEEALEEVRKLLKEHGGEIYHEDIWGVRDLAYRIKKQDQAYYAVFNFEIESAKLNELKQPLNLQNELLRHLIIKTPHTYELKTLEEYEEEGRKEDEEMEKKKNEEKNSKPSASSKTSKRSEEPKEKNKEETLEKASKPEKEKSKKTEEKEESKKSDEDEKEVKEDSKKAEEASKTEEEPKLKKEASKKLDEVDEKLKSIINDPDISL